MKNPQNTITAQRNPASLDITQERLTSPEIPFDNLMQGAFDLIHLPDGFFLSETQRQQLLAALNARQYTFTHPDMPSCWGKAFENYLSQAEYLAPHPDDAAIAALCAPIQAKVDALLAASGLRARPLTDAITGKPYAVADFRRTRIAPRSTMLHVDDLRQDATLKPDFILPAELEGRTYHQYMVLYMLDTRGATATLRCHHRRYRPYHEHHRLNNGWQFSHDVVTEFGHTDWQPTPGGAVIMPNHYFHDILGGGAVGEWLYYSQYLLFLPDTGEVYTYV